MSSPETPDEVDSVTQSSRPAAGAPPVATLAPNSVFALAQQSAGAEPEADGGVQAPDMADLEQQALELLGKGDASTSRVADAIGIGYSTAKRLTERLAKAKKIYMVGAGRACRWSLAKGGFQGWLRSKASKGKSKPAKRPAKPAAKARKAAKPVAKPVTALARAPLQPVAAVVPATPEPEISCGLFSNGEIQIDVPDDTLRLNRAQARYLVDWLLKVDAALRA